MMKRTFGALMVTVVLTLPGIRRVQDAGSPPVLSRSLLAGQIVPAPPSSTGVPQSFLRNPLFFLSNAPSDSLTLLPGIGPVLAERIAGARTGKRSFTDWDDLLAVKGIGPKKLDRLRTLTE